MPSNLPSRHACAVVILVVAIASVLLAPRSAEAQDSVALGCLARDRIECGCTVRLAAATCSADATSTSYQLYSALADGSPLWIVLDGREIELKSTRPASQSFSFSRGDSWTERYVTAGMSVSVSYRPERNSCRKPPPETCEYFDVQATVTVERDKQPRFRYEGVGSCGC